MGLNTYAKDFLNIHDYERKRDVLVDGSAAVRREYEYRCYFEYGVSSRPLLPQNKFAWRANVIDRLTAKLEATQSGYADTKEDARFDAQTWIAAEMKKHRRP
jgi:hypothetical protein